MWLCSYGYVRYTYNPQCFCNIIYHLKGSLLNGNLFNENEKKRYIQSYIQTFNAAAKTNHYGRFRKIKKKKEKKP